MSQTTYETQDLNGFTKTHIVTQNTPLDNSDAFHLDPFVTIIKELNTCSLITSEEAADGNRDNYPWVVRVQAIRLLSLFLRRALEAGFHTEFFCSAL